MKTTKENSVKKRLKIFLDSIPNLYYYSATAGAYSTGGIPDIIGVYKGLFFGIEVKAPGRRGETNRGCSGLQVLQMSKMRAAGAFVMAFDGEEDDWEILTQWVEEN